MPPIKHGESITDRRSTFQPHLAPVVTPRQVKHIVVALCLNIVTTPSRWQLGCRKALITERLPYSGPRPSKWHGAVLKASTCLKSRDILQRQVSSKEQTNRNDSHLPHCQRVLGPTEGKGDEKNTHFCVVRVNWGTLYPHSSVSDAIISANRSPLCWRWAFIICSLAWSVLEGLCHAWLQPQWLWDRFLQRYIITSAVYATWRRFTEVRRTCWVTSVNFQLRVCSIIPPVSTEEKSVRDVKIQNQLVYMEVVGHQSQSNRWISGCVLNRNIHLLSLLYFLHVSPLLIGNTTLLHINKLLQKCCKLYVD